MAFVIGRLSMHYDRTQGFSEQNESQSDREEQRQISERSGDDRTQQTIAF
jgi:hypothetical protein